jgi:hypothetical protein
VDLHGNTDHHPFQFILMAKAPERQPLLAPGAVVAACVLIMIFVVFFW